MFICACVDVTLGKWNSVIMVVNSIKVCNLLTYVGFVSPSVKSGSKAKAHGIECETTPGT